MIEIGHMAFPRSISDIPSFVNLATLTTMLLVTEAFWHLCRPVESPATIDARRRPMCEALYEVISSEKKIVI
jgi:hypothetical protein